MALIYLVFFIFVAAYFYLIRNFGYWKEKGIKHDPPLPIFGNNLKQFIQRCSMAMMANEIYRKYPNEKVVGFYRSSSPELVIRDPEIIKRILTTDSQHFHARGIHPGGIKKQKVEPLLKNLFFADGDLWRLLRQRFTPAFSSGKLKAMFPIITERAKKLQIFSETLVTKDAYDMRELMARYTTEFIGVCGFGLDIDCMSDDSSQFRKLGKRIFQRDFRDVMAAFLKFVFPKVFENIHLLSSELQTSMVYLVTNIMKKRNYKPAGKNDFIDLLLEIREQRYMVGESIMEKNPDGSPRIVEMELDDLLLTAQVFVFFGAGFETSSSASSYALHELAFHPEWQEKVQIEIDRVLAKYDDEITYEAVKEMTNLEMVFNEALRKFPPVAYLMRTCVSPKYTFPEIDLTIDENVKVMIPIQAIQNDEKYFEDPEKFCPERFHPENQKIRNFTYLPFGEGPRSCVGARLGKMQSMAGLVAVLQKFSVEPAASTLREPLQDPQGIVSENFVGGLPLRLRKRAKIL